MLLQQNLVWKDSKECNFLTRFNHGSSKFSVQIQKNLVAKYKSTETFVANVIMNLKISCL